MEATHLITLITAIVTWILGYFAKKYSWVDTNLIPLQNLLIGLIIAIIEWIITKDFSTAIMLSGLFAGGTYDLGHNLMKLRKGE